MWSPLSVYSMYACKSASVCVCVRAHLGMCSAVCNMFPSARNQPDLPRLHTHTQTLVCVCFCVLCLTHKAVAQLCSVSLRVAESADPQTDKREDSGRSF